MNKDYLPLVNELRGPLSEYRIMADDLDMKTLNKCKKILSAVNDIKMERKDCEDTLSSLEINFKTIEGRTGIDRKSLAENDVYRLIITTAKTNKEAKTEKRIQELSLELEQYKKWEKDLEDTKQQQMAINIKYATSEQDKEDLKREWDITKESLQQANEKILKLEKENMKLRQVLESYQGQFTVSKS